MLIVVQNQSDWLFNMKSSAVFVMILWIILDVCIALSFYILPFKERPSSVFIPVIGYDNFRFETLLTFWTIRHVPKKKGADLPSAQLEIPVFLKDVGPAGDDKRKSFKLWHGNDSEIFLKVHF